MGVPDVDLALQGDGPEAKALRSGVHLARNFRTVPLMLFGYARTDASGIYPALCSAMLAARAEGVGSTLTGMLHASHQEEIGQLLGVPEDQGWRMYGVVAMGYPQGRWGMFSYPLFERLKADAPAFEELTAFQAGGARLSVRRERVDTAARPLRSEYVTGNYFSTLGVNAFTGRVFTADDDRPAAPPTIVLAYHLWQGVYGGDASVVGSTFLRSCGLASIPFCQSHTGLNSSCRIPAS